MKKRNYRENFFISEKLSVIYISKERAYFISVIKYFLFSNLIHIKILLPKILFKKLKTFIFLVSNLMKNLVKFTKNNMIL